MKRSRLTRIRRLRATIAEHSDDDERTIEARLRLVDEYQDNGYDDQDEPRWRGLANAELRHVLESRRRTLGLDHPDTLAIWYRLIMEARGGIDNLPPAEVAQMEDIAAARERVLGPHHPDTLETLGRLLVLKGGLGLRDRVTRGWEHVLAEREQRLGPDDPETSAARIELAGLYDDDRPEEARRLRSEVTDAFGRVAADLSNRLGPVHPDTVKARRKYANLYGIADTTRRDEATHMVEEITADHERILGSDHPRTLHAQVELARRYGWFDERGTALAKSLIGRLYEASEPDYEDISYLRYLIAATALKAGNRDEFAFVYARYTVPDDADDDLMPGNPDYPEDDDDI